MALHLIELKILLLNVFFFFFKFACELCTYCICKHLENYCFSEATSNCFVTHILQNIFFYVQQKKEIYTGLQKLEGE